MSTSADTHRLRLLAACLCAATFVALLMTPAQGQTPEEVPAEHPLSWVGPDGTIHLDRMPVSGMTEPSMSPVMVGSPYLPPGAACGPGYACPPPCPQVECCICEPCVVPPHRHSLFFDVLYLHPTGVDLTHAQQQNGVGGAGTTPFGTIAVLDPTFKPGYRIGGNFALGCYSSFALTYTEFINGTTSSLTPPTIPGGGGAVGSLVHHPGAGILASAGPVDGSYDINFRMADFDFRQLLDGDCRHWVNYTAGIRLAQLDQDFRQLGVFSGSSAGVMETQTLMDFEGAGIKLGLEGERVIGCRGFSIFARANASPMFGEFTNRYVMRNDTVDVTLAQASWSDDRIVTVIDYEFGVAWTGPKGRLRLSTGYMASHWYNIISNSSFIDSVQADNYGHNSDSMTFDGLTGRAEWRF